MSRPVKFPGKRYRPSGFGEGMKPGTVGAALTLLVLRYLLTCQVGELPCILLP
jgi:hypothetical protein